MNTALDLAFLADWEFIGSVGDYKHKQACVMSAAVAAVRVARGVDMNGATDELECVDPGVRKLCILRNDLTADPIARKTWALSMIPRIIGTAGGKDLERARAEAIARYAARVIAAEAMDSAKLPAEAGKLRALDANASMSAVRSVANEVRDSTRKERDKRCAAVGAAAADAAAAAAADAAADAAYAYAAAAAADAAYAYAAAAAADAAYAYAAAAAAYAAAADAAADAAYAYAAAAAADAAYAYAAAAAADAAAAAAAAYAADAAAAAYAAAAAATYAAAAARRQIRHLDALLEECLAITAAPSAGEIKKLATQNSAVQQRSRSAPRGSTDTTH